MFTGIVREVGEVAEVAGDGVGRTLVVAAPGTAPTTAVGDSVAIDGVCLTAETVEGSRIHFHAVPETLARTTLGTLDAGAAVNVEPALRAGEPLGGHIVQGHVDDVGTILSVAEEGDGLRVRIGAGTHVLRYCVEKGSITVDGVSLTVAELHEVAFAVALVPHTLSATTLGTLVAERRVNLEVDVLAKYVERLLDRR
jgi:riboflavin synthase